MVKRIVQSALFYRVAESIIPILTWILITFPVWFSPFHPAVVSYFILAFILYFFYKSMKTLYFAFVSYKLINQAAKVDWSKKLSSLPHHRDIVHVFIITNYKESAEKLSQTIEHISDQHYDKAKMHVVLAMEEREGDEARKRAKAMEEKYNQIFRSITSVFHVLETGEVVGKASNEACAARIVADRMKREGIDPTHVLVTVCDADSLLPLEYTSYLTYEYLVDKDRLYHFYWAPVLLYNNFWKLPLPIRLQSTLSSLLRLSFLSQKDDLIQISTYSTSLKLLQAVNFWDVDIIPEDWHIWLQAFFAFGDRVKTIPIYLPICADAVLAKGLFRTFKSRYEQEMRWAWGASDIPYAIKRSFETPHISWVVKLRKILQLAETHLMWPTTFFILTLSASIPPLVNPVFKRTVMGFLLPKLSSFILTISSSLLIVFLYFDYKLRKRVKVETKLLNLPLLFVQWYFLPIISFLFSSLPALEAHTRMLLGKKLEYKVTEKV
ncbi:MAG TPA: hypothetical protein VJH96_01080 [Patescibacteria group bacterium]|nr:hypothetical protein [Patescibacteria group bacterium]